MDSILNSIKQLLGIESTFDGFDTDVIFGINTALMSLNQLGIGPEAGFSISDDTAVWNDFLEGATNIDGVKSYIYLKTKLLFDPPGNSFLVTAVDNQIKELASRLMIQVDPDWVDPVV